MYVFQDKDMIQNVKISIFWLTNVPLVKMDIIYLPMEPNVFNIQFRLKTVFSSIIKIVPNVQI